MSSKQDDTEGPIDWRGIKIFGTIICIAAGILFLIAFTNRTPSPPQNNKDELQKARDNFSGAAHDGFICKVDNYAKPLVSFDNGGSWWSDDGRCAPSLTEQIKDARQQLETQQQEERQRQKKEAQEAQRQQEEETRKLLQLSDTTRAQQQRDEDARIHSYWSTTIRVDTDMNSFWLPNEERTCQTYPNQQGRVAMVSCDAGTEKTIHNIPVVFWGGVDRNKISSWKCSREKDLLNDQFVCRAID